MCFLIHFDVGNEVKPCQGVGYVMFMEGVAYHKQSSFFMVEFFSTSETKNSVYISMPLLDFGFYFVFIFVLIILRQQKIFINS